MTQATLFDEPTEAPPTVILRDYQDKCVKAIHAAHDRGLHRVLVVQPTGTGKTTVFSKVVGDFDAMGHKSLVLAHRSELLEQAAERIATQNPHIPVGIEGGEYRAGSGNRAIVAGVQTIGRETTTRLSTFHPGLCVIDEAHHAPATSYQIVLRKVGAYEGRCFTVGVTATPHRMDNRPLHGTEKSIFEEVVFQYSLREAIQDHYLCDLRGYRVATGLDLSAVKTTAGDYNQGQLQSLVNVDARNLAALRHWQETCADRQTIVFTAGVQHAKDVAEVFKSAGIRAESVDGAMDRHTRAAIIKRFRTGQTQVLTNMDICTEGFDAPEVACVLMLRPTQSWALFAQMIGRGLRLAKNKLDCIVIDVVDNTAKHSAASVPAMLGLPADMDLQGKSLKEAAEKFDLLSEVEKSVLFKRPSTFETLSTQLTAVDLLGELSIPDGIAGIAALSWLKIGDGKYLLDVSHTESAHLTADPLGRWHVEIRTPAGPFVKELGDDLKAAFIEAERDIRQAIPDAVRFGVNCKWRNDPPTEGQIRMLRKHRVEEGIIKQLNKGQASQLITSKLAAKRGKR